MDLKGLGNKKANLVVLTEHFPPLLEFENLECIRSVKENELKTIGDLTSNHWRKIFNCYSKLAFELDSKGQKSWQDLRNFFLLNSISDQLLLFLV